MMLATVVRIGAVLLNALAAFWWFTYAVTWGPNDFIGGAIAAVPPLLAVIALTLGRRRELLALGKP
jgi:hypothetical protein